MPLAGSLRVSVGARGLIVFDRQSPLLIGRTPGRQGGICSARTGAAYDVHSGGLERGVNLLADLEPQFLR